MENFIEKSGSDLFVFADSIEWETTGEGVRRKILGFDKNLMLLIVEFKKGSRGYLHKHIHTQTSYIISGSFEVTIGGEMKVQKAGDCYFLPPDIEHGVLALEDSCLIDVFTPCREDFLQK